MKNILLTIAIYFALTSQFAFGNGPNDYPPTCVYDNNCDVITREIKIDFEKISSQISIIRNDTGNRRNSALGGCPQSVFSLGTNALITLPTIDQNPGWDYYFTRKSFFNSEIDPETIFKTTVESLVNTGLQSCSATSTIIMEFKNETEAEKNNLRLLIPKEDIDTVARLDRYDNIVFEGEGKFAEFDWNWISRFESAPLPNTLKHKEYFYEPAGFYCDKQGICNFIVIYKTKEILTFNNNQKQEKTFAKPDFGNTVFYQTLTEIDVVKKTFTGSSPSPIITASPETKITVSPATSTLMTNGIDFENRPSGIKEIIIRLWQRLVCFLNQIFGVKCFND